MRTFFKNHKYIVILITLSILDIINIKKYIPLSNDYDWLSFFGTIIATTFGVIATIEAVKMTIIEENKKRKEDLAIQYKPHLIIEEKKGKKDNGAIMVAWVRSAEYNACENYLKMNNSSLILKLKNNGRGEAIKIRVTDLEIDCCLGDGNPGKKAIYDDINSNRILGTLYPNEEYQIAFNVPETIILDKEYYNRYQEYYFRITINIEYYDLFEYNKYDLNMILQFRINLKELKVVNEFDDKVELKGSTYLDEIIFPKK